LVLTELKSAELTIYLSLITKTRENLPKDNQDDPISDTKCEATLVPMQLVYDQTDFIDLIPKLCYRNNTVCAAMANIALINDSEICTKVQHIQW